jgi:hypothetical protein
MLLKAKILEKSQDFRPAAFGVGRNLHKYHEIAGNKPFPAFLD